MPALLLFFAAGQCVVCILKYSPSAHSAAPANLASSDDRQVVFVLVGASGTLLGLVELFFFKVKTCVSPG